MRRIMRQLILFTSLIFVLFALAGCARENTDIFKDKDFTLNSVELGLSFVPDSNDKYRENTLEHLEYLGISHVRMGYSWRLRQENMGDEYYMQPMYDRMDFYDENHIDVLMTIDIKSFPDWAFELEEEEFLSCYRDMIKSALAGFGSRLKIIQLGNEWDWELDGYLNSDVELFIKMNNILYDEVQNMDAKERPSVALSSFSAGGVVSISYSQGRMDNIYFDGEPLFSEEEMIELMPRIEKTNSWAEQMINECRFDAVDIHLYDDYWNWQHYMDAVNLLLCDADKSGEVFFVASEFGGPNPQMEIEDDEYRAQQLYNYVKTIDSIGIDTAYYFKLHEDLTGEGVYHPYSYLIKKNGSTTKTYEMLARFSEFTK